MKKVAVIGSNSFSGSDFIDLLLRETDYQILGISRSAEKKALFLPYKNNPAQSRFAFYQLDINKNLKSLIDLFSQEKPGYIVNFAAQSEVGPSWDHPEQWFQTNAVAVAALGNFLRKQKWLERYVHISSPEVYGSCEGTVFEDAPLNPKHAIRGLQSCRRPHAFYARKKLWLSHGYDTFYECVRCPSAATQNNSEKYYLSQKKQNDTTAWRR